MKEINFEEFSSSAPASKEIIEKYRDKLPANLIESWEKFGFGIQSNPYVKAVNPDEYLEIVGDGNYNMDDGIPIFVTADGDTIAWKDGKSICYISLRYDGGKKDES